MPTSLFPLPNFLANSGSEWTTSQILQLGGTGLAGVLVILFILTGIIAALSIFFKEKKKPVASMTAPAPTTTNPPPMSANAATAPAAGISEEHLSVVIAAAVHTALASRQRTLRLTPGDNSWAFEGRRAIFHSRAMSAPRIKFSR